MPSRRYVALLRGINLGTRHRVQMARLREVCEAAGATNVRTLIASGNVVLDSELSAVQLRTRLERDIEAEFGFTSIVVLLTAAQLRTVVKRNPFPRAEPKSLHVAFAAGPIEPKTKAILESLTAGQEQAAVIGRQIYLYLPHGFGRTNLPGAAMGKMSPPVTIRGWPTVLRLNDMAAVRE